ncbi:MAG: prepilin-type N-terminal cleavage/methylation domain-containing protein, partial [Bacilli bacterium]|nr:prepilin-type N-terminal cleavage/methylation domain-containing protein [Bacilli bacterium]
MGGGNLNKAFTLIELLAIIVILAIIAIITIPIILNVVDNSSKGAAVDSAYGYKDAIN